MVGTNIGRHHLHSRKRMYVNMEEYPHPDKLTNFVDKLVYVAGMIGVLMTIPQIWLIFSEKNASGLSIYSWISYWIIGIIWLFYGFLHKERPIIVLNIIWFFLYILMIVGIIMYG